MKILILCILFSIMNLSMVTNAASEEYSLTLENSTEIVDHVDIILEKTWSEESEGSISGEITVKVTGSVAGIEVCSYDVILTQENSWTAVLENVPLYDGDGNLIEYQVKEQEKAVPELSLEKWQQAMRGEVVVCEKTQEFCKVEGGDLVTFYLQVKNHGEGNAVAVEITDAMPEGLILETISHHGVTDELGIIKWNIDTVEAGETAEVSFTVRIPVSESDEVWENVGYVVYNDEEDTLGNKEPEESNQVETGKVTPKISIRKTQRKNAEEETTEQVIAAEQDEVTYFITLSNNGTAEARNIMVKDVIPEGLTVVESTITDGGTVSEETVVWTVDSINAGETKTLSFTVIVPEVLQDTVWKNTATVVYENDPTAPEDPEESNEVVILQGAPLVEIVKSQKVNDGEVTQELQQVEAGDVVRYYIQVINKGTETAKGITVFDVVPEGLIINENSISSGGVLDENRIVWEADVLEPGQKIELSFAVEVPKVKEETVWDNMAQTVHGNNPEGPDEVEESNEVSIENIDVVPEEGIQTGDGTPTALWSVLAISSLTMCIGLLFNEKKKRAQRS